MVLARERCVSLGSVITERERRNERGMKTVKEQGECTHISGTKVSLSSWGGI